MVREPENSALHTSPHHMALDVQDSTRAAYPHLYQDLTCRGPLLHLVAVNKQNVLHSSKSTPVEIDPTISHLLSLIPGHQPLADEHAIPDNLAPMIAMQAPQGHFPRPSREYLPAIAPRKRRASPSSDSGHNTSLTSKSVAGVSRTRLPPRSRFGCW